MKRALALLVIAGLFSTAVAQTPQPKQTTAKTAEKKEKCAKGDACCQKDKSAKTAKTEKKASAPTKKS